MASIDYQEARKEIVKQFRSKGSNGRKILFWYDAPAVFKEDITTDSLDCCRLLVCDRNEFSIKKTIEHDDPDSNFLVYIPHERPVDTENWNAAFSQEPEKQKGKFKLAWCIYGVIAVLMLGFAIFEPVEKSRTYSDHMPEPLRAELVELHGTEGQRAEPIGTYVFDTVTIYVYDEYHYTANRYQEEGLKGLIPRFNHNGEYHCRVEVIRVAREKYTTNQFARAEAVWYYDAEITDAGKTAAIDVGSKSRDDWPTDQIVPAEELAKEAYDSFERYRRN